MTVVNLKNRLLVSGIISFICLLMTGVSVFAQCPTTSGTTISKTDELCFEANDGTITFIFSNGSYPSVTDYRVRLWNFEEGPTGAYVYDDNNPPFLNIVPAPSIIADMLVFSNVPPGDYLLVLDGGSCSNEDYGFLFSGAPNSGIRVNAATEIIIDEPTIATIGNDKCTAPFNGSIDATGTVSGGAGGFEYSIDGGTNFQLSPVFSNLENNTYTLTVRDANGCIKEETNIVVDDNRVAPTAGITPSPSVVCAGEDLILNGNPAGGAGGFTHSWTGDTGFLSATNVSNPTFNAGTDGNYSLTYTVTDANGCTASSNITVTVNALPTVVDQTPEVCADIPGGTQATGVDLTTLNAAIDGGNGYTINWYADTGPATPVADPTNVTVNDGDDFFAEVIDGNGCSTVATVTYNVISAPIAPTNVATSNIVCDGFELSWDVPATATSYRIEIDEDPAYGSPEVNTTQAGNTLNVSGLILGTVYNIRITPINSCGDGAAATDTETTTDVPLALANLASANPV
ncbi:fibronectin type III domain-containing protein, partial [Catalinimonas sp. 4WD22]|uniref:fibronectin type III domain-containing protein n=1 Tax=Catalinimonas locisalis TaxID=3133978 RepID=UPI003100D59C